jgi:hypothetical protein
MPGSDGGPGPTKAVQVSSQGRGGVPVSEAFGTGVARRNSPSPRPFRPMDKQTKREVWLLAIGRVLVELPVAFAAFTILSH